MLNLVTGRTGSGKSYFCITQILDYLNDDFVVYTNIKLNLTMNNYHFLNELDFKKFFQYVDDTFTNVDNLEEKKEEVRNSKYYKAVFFIDEIQLIGMKKLSEPIKNWFSLHRHFGQEIYVITPNPSNLHRDYIADFHYHYDVIPPNKRLMKNLIGYRRYDGVKGNRDFTKYIQPKQEIFEIYKTGSNEKATNQNIVKASAVGILSVFFFYYGVHNLFNMDILKKNDNNSTKQTENNITDNNISTPEICTILQHDTKISGVDPIATTVENNHLIYFYKSCRKVHDD